MMVENVWDKIFTAHDQRKKPGEENKLTDTSTVSKSVLLRHAYVTIITGPRMG